jgi:GT2 family glycosyltransferase
VTAAVVIPTRDRPRSLARCLAALDRQEGMSELQVVVVDDGSRRADDVAAIVASSQRARLVRHDSPQGPSAARNTGIRAVSSDAVMFTDDDCEPASDWARQLASRLEEGADAAAGLSVNGRPGDPLASASETIVQHIQRQARGAAASTAFAASNNLACATDILREIPFDEAYRYAEDRDWCARLLSAGHSLVFDETAVIVHHQELTVSTFWRKHVGYGRGAYRFRRRHGSISRLEPPQFYLGLLRRGFAQGPAPGLLVGLAQVATAVGFVSQAMAERARPARI